MLCGVSPELTAILRRPLTRGCLQDTVYLIVCFVTGLIGFVVLVSAGSTVFGLSILIFGLPLAVLLAHFDRWWCGHERVRAGRILRRQVPAPYAPTPEGGRLDRALATLRDHQTWFDALWMLLSFPLGLTGFVLAVVLWTVVPALLTAPIYEWSLPGWTHAHVVLLSIVEPLVALPAAVVSAWVIRGAAVTQAWVAASLLGARRTEILQQRVQTLSETRAGAVDVAVTELQRVERDLHDGAQARLVALAMDLGLAEQRLAQADPETAMEHVAAARGQARAAMADLRDLVRGIGPSILTDRGLDAALTALVSGRTPPVALRVSLPGTEVTPRETAAYFVVAEALANARKHARASAVSVDVFEAGDRTLVVEVVDDGVGGAAFDGGSGLIGLRKRLAALDGTLTVTSPASGPTSVRAELPCAS
jgi:signal transduction histidine kinase